MKTPNFPIRTLVTFALIPAIVLITLVMVWRAYEDLYRIVLKGFDRKIMAASTVTGSFIEGERHRTLDIPREMTALAWAGEEGKLYGITAKGELAFLETFRGSAGKAVPLEGAVPADLAWHPEIGLVGLLPGVSSSRLVEIKPLTGKEREIGIVPVPLHALAWNGKGWYAAGGEGLYRLDLKRGKAQKLCAPEIAVASLASREGVLYAVPEEGEKPGTLDPETCAFAPIVGEPEMDEEEEEEAPELTYKTLAFDPAAGRFYSGTGHLIGWDAGGKTIEHMDFARGYRNEAGPVFKEYYQAMKEIKQGCNLTYHYTQQLIYGDDEAQCYYLIDIHDGNEYAPIGTEDTLDAKDFRDALSVLYQGNVVISDIRQFEEWGLLKAGYAPIFNEDGTAAAIAGTDIDITIIRDKTREAMIWVGLSGAIALILGAGAALAIARRISRPVSLLKAGALKVAAGHFGEKVVVERPTELVALSGSFNEMSGDLDRMLTSLEASNKELRRRFVEEELALKLARTAQAPVGGERIAAALPVGRERASGWIATAAGFGFWEGDLPPGQEGARYRAREALQLRILLESGREPEAALRAFLASYPRVRWAGVLEEEGGGLLLVAAQEETFLLEKEGEEEKTATLAPGDLLACTVRSFDYPAGPDREEPGIAVRYRKEGIDDLS